MKYYTLNWINYDVFVDAIPECFLPNWKCPICGQDSARGCGHRLPQVDPNIFSSATKRALKYMSRPNCRLSSDKIEQVRMGLRNAIKFPSPIPPGTTFGRLAGKQSEQFRGVSEIFSGTIGATKQQCGQLMCAGISVETFETNIVPLKGDSANEIVELWAAPIAHCSSALLQYWCPACKRLILPETKSLVVNETSIPTGCDIFRVWELPANPCVSERFVNLLTETGINNVDWVPLQTSER